MISGLWQMRIEHFLWACISNEYTYATNTESESKSKSKFSIEIWKLCVLQGKNSFLRFVIFFSFWIKMLSANEMRLKNLDILSVTFVTLLIRLFLHVNFNRNISPAKVFVLFFYFVLNLFPGRLSQCFLNVSLRKLHKFDNSRLS